MHSPSDMIFEVEATITERGQTTVPASIRRVLGLELKGSVVFRSMADGSVLLVPKGSEEDPVLGSFLDFLETDMAMRPQKLAAVSQQQFDAAVDLIRDVDIDLDAPLTDD